MAPKPQRILGTEIPRDGEHVFYWSDTGPVECSYTGGVLIQARTVEPLSAVIDGVELEPAPRLYLSEP